MGKKKKATPAPMGEWLALASCVGIAGVGFVVARSVHYSIQQQENADRVKPRLTVRLGFLQIHFGSVHFDGILRGASESGASEELLVVAPCARAKGARLLSLTSASVGSGNPPSPSHGGGCSSPPSPSHGGGC